MQATSQLCLHRSLGTMLMILSIILGASRIVVAQSDVPKVEVGGQFTLLHLPLNARGFETTAKGGGVRGTFNCNGNIGLEAEVNFYPEINPGPFIIDSPAVVSLFGVKAGKRAERVGVFGKVRPGFIHFEEKLNPRIVFIIEPPKPQNPHFALDVGGVVELYPSRRVVVRFDVGDTIIRFRYRSPLLGNSRFTQHNLQFNAGMGIRF